MERITRHHDRMMVQMSQLNKMKWEVLSHLEECQIMFPWPEYIRNCVWFYCAPPHRKKDPVLSGYQDNRNKDCTLRVGRKQIVGAVCVNSSQQPINERFTWWPTNMAWMSDATAPLCCVFYLFFSGVWNIQGVTEGEVAILGHGDLGNENLCTERRHNKLQFTRSL